jgi:medium-chain acyl-[acyl-carrier-protein] hydrolase
MKVGPDKWTLTPEPRPDARLRLLCFHHAGGGAYGYRPWARLLRPDIELVAVQLPGRENRHGEPPLSSVESVLDGLVRALRESFATPYAVFGHSMGAILAYALALRVRRTGELAEPVRLFLSAARVPRAREPGADAAPVPLTDEALIRRLTRLGGTPRAVLDEPGLLRAFLPALRADFSILQQFSGDDEPPLDIPLTFLRGAEDRLVRAEHFSEWRARSLWPAHEHTLPGGHFYLHTVQGTVVGIVNHTLGADAAAETGEPAHMPGR